VNRPAPWVIGLALAGCSDLTSGSGGVVALELRLPSPAVVEQNDTLRLHARALDAEGDSVAIAVFWRTLDDTLLTVVDSAAGLVTTARTSGQARVQARVGTLRSDIVTLTLRPRSDTLIVAVADTITVPAADSVSDSLYARVESLTPAGGVAGTSILFQLVDSAAARGVLRFANGLLTFRAATSTTGAPATRVTLRKVVNQVPPPVVEVRVSASRPSGIAVPGSGQIITLLFQ